MDLKTLLRTFDLDAIIGADAETYYDKDYSLKKMPTTEYIVDPRFKLHCWALSKNGVKASVVKELPKINWKRTGFLAHHAHFDGYIASHHLGVHPKMFFDTLAMARIIMPVQVALNLDSLGRALQVGGKENAQALVDIMGKRDLTPQEYRQLATYAGRDIDVTWAIFFKLLPFVPVDELKLIDITTKMYTRPTLQLNRAMVGRVNEEARTKKADLIKRSRTSADTLGSADQFAEALRKLRVEPPTKQNKHGDTVYAFAKNDLAFKALLDHPRKAVRDLIEARFAIKSTQMETRSARMSKRAAVLDAQPVYLKYAGAQRTFRWSGSDKMNWQNFKRGSDMRKAVRAPPGYRLIILDQAQIEARKNAWLAGDKKKLNAFRLYDQGKGPDVYKIGAADIYSIKPEDVTKDQRFLGKTAELGLGYGAGAPKFANMLRVGQFGPPVKISDDDALDVVRRWRASNTPIVNNWTAVNNAAKSAWLSQSRVPYGPVIFVGFNDTLKVELPNGTVLRYDGMKIDDYGELSYISRVKHLQKGGMTVMRTKYYGGIGVENLCQALSRVLIGWQMVHLAKLPVHIATTTHDEVVLIAKARDAESVRKRAVKIMSVAPAWAHGLPLSVASEVNSIYAKE